MYAKRLKYMHNNSQSAVNRYGTVFSALLHAVCAIGIMGLSANVSAFDSNLTPAQQQVYDHPHLSNTTTGQIVKYRYESISADGSTIEDMATLTIKDKSASDDADRRNVAINFLSAERRIALPDFDNYRGNPIIIAMLEHICQSLGQVSGGGSLYFRNRVRDALAKRDLEINTGTLEVNGTTVETRNISIQPLLDDAKLNTHPHLKKAVISITLSDDVLAGVSSISIESGSEASGPFNRTLTLISN